MPAPTISPLPTPPSRSTDPTNFAIKADAFVAALPEFATDANAQAAYLDGVATAVDADAASAAIDAYTASAAAIAALAAADVGLWISGTTYAIGDNAISPVSFQTYRRKTTGTGTTDPSLDTANWALLTFYPKTPLQVIGDAAGGSELRLPEDTDNGSNYVALKSPAALADNLTLTLPSADGTAGQVLSTNGSGGLSFMTAASANIQEFTTSSTWTKPAGAQFVMVECWGAGGGGGGGARAPAATVRSGGDGGGGGAYTYRLFKASDLGTTETITIGAGGAGGAARTVDGTHAAGTNGGNTSFGSNLFSYGGGGASPINPGLGGGVLSAANLSTSAGAPTFTTETVGQFGGARAGESPSGFGGGSGGTNGAATAKPGGCSYQGGAGGGAGGALDSANVTYVGQSGGFNIGVTGGGGGGGGAGTGTSGGSGTSVQIGGGGGGSGNTAGTIAGGNGGTGGPAGGGGGGGGSTTGANSGAGGAGGNGLVRVYTW